MDPNRQPSALRPSVASAADRHSGGGESEAAAAVTALFAVNARSQPVLLLRGTKLTPVTGLRNAVGPNDVAW
jgi:hypothetical protein